MSISLEDVIPRCRKAVAAIALSIFVLNTGALRAQVRPEIVPVQTMTLSTKQFLTQDKNGKSTTLAGELRIPAKPGKLPAVILIHGSGGLNESHEQWAREFNAIGVAAFLLDSFAARGITSTINDQSQLDSLTMMVDGFAVLGLLAQHPRIDSSRIAIMGFSKGGVAALYSANDRFRQAYAPPNLQFAAHIGLYAGCNITYRGDEKLTGKPIRLFHGTADDYDPIEPCRDYVARLKKVGADITLTEFPGVYHAYDNPAYKGETPFLFPQALATAHCELIEGDNGLILNKKMGQPFNAKDSCVVIGPHVAYNEEATIATVKAVKAFLIATFHL